MSPSAKRARLENLPHDHKQLPLPHEIPEDIIVSKIFPLLSFTNLSKLKRVCKSWCSFISSNPMLPLDRYRRAVVSPSYSGVVFSRSGSGSWFFLPTCGDPLYFPDLLNIRFTRRHPGMETVASTNGLLCLGFNPHGFYLCNPSTKEKHAIPWRNSRHDFPDVLVWLSAVGLAYDPSESPARYKLVCPWSKYEGGRRYAFGFDVFSSETNQWKNSFSKVGYVECNYFYIKNSVYAGGVLYWNCITCLMYFDPEKDIVGGTVPLPCDPSDVVWDQHEIGEFGGNLTFSRVSRKGGMELWIMDGDRRGYWELMHWVSLETMFKKHGGLWNRKKWWKYRFFRQFHVLVVPYDGSERLFMRVCLRGKGRQKVFCYNMKSGKLKKFYTLWTDTDRYFRQHHTSFLYQSNSQW